MHFRKTVVAVNACPAISDVNALLWQACLLLSSAFRYHFIAAELGILTCYIQVKRNGVKLPFLACEAPENIAKSIRPIDQIKMTDTIECALVDSPLTAPHTHHSVIWPFEALYDVM